MKKSPTTRVGSERSKLMKINRSFDGFEKEWEFRIEDPDNPVKSSYYIYFNGIK